MMDGSARRIDAARLRLAVHPLGTPPCATARAAAWHSGSTDAAPPRAAAVLIPFVSRGDVLSILFTRRAQHLRQHAGQISFPGGGIEARDADALAAALRETEEETGISPALVETFGYLDCLDTVSGYSVTPVTGFVRGDYAVQRQVEEVDEVFEVPLDFITEPSNLKRESILWRGIERDIFSIVWEGRRIWGVTAAILKNLLDRLEKS